MPGVYKEKVCPQCGVKHRKRGEFCSKTCSNKARDPQVYEKVSQYMKSDEGQLSTYRLNYDEDMEPPVAGGMGKIDERPNGFVSGGDLWLTDNGDW